ncbi:MAG: Holliday junction resolvase RuvX [Gemmatimonadota bacterium]
MRPPPNPNICYIPHHGRVLGLDWGTSRIGLAITDETQLIASPLTTLRQRTGKRPPLGEFLTIVERELPVGLVVGLPLDDEGAEGESARAAHELGELFARRAKLPMDLVDESFSTTTALETITSLGKRPRNAREIVDAMAAAVVLQRWLEMRRGGSK